MDDDNEVIHDDDDMEQMTGCMKMSGLRPDTTAWILGLDGHRYCQDYNEYQEARDLEFGVGSWESGWAMEAGSRHLMGFRVWDSELGVRVHKENWVARKLEIRGYSRWSC